MITNGLFHLSEEQKLAVLTSLQAIVDDGREERVTTIHDRIGDLKNVIDTRMKLRERVQQRYETVQTSLKIMDSGNRTDVTQPVISLLRSYGAQLKRRMAELRPDAELKRKQELEADLALIEAHRDVAIVLQRTLRPEFAR